MSDPLTTPADANRLQHHPRIQALRDVVERLPIDANYRAALHRSLELYADQIIERQPDEGWDDLEALQQVTLGDMMEASMRAQFESRRKQP